VKCAVPDNSKRLKNFDGESLAADLEVLREKLGDYATLYGSDDPHHQRMAVMSSLCSVTDFLNAHGFGPEMLLPIMRPSLALAERENNSIDQMFAERVRGGRPKATLDEHERTGILAAFADAWLRIHAHDHRPQKLKLADAARHMRGDWFGSLDRVKLKTARDIVNQEAKTHPAVMIARVFDDMFQEAIATVGLANAFQLMVQYVNQAQAGQASGIWKTHSVSPSAEV